MADQLEKAQKGTGTLVSQVSEALRREIAAGAYRPGDKLPSEARLTEAHGVSRTVVREAIATLRSDGLVEARQGAGIFVLEAVQSTMPSFQNLDTARVFSIIELLELRTAVEVESAALAAQRRSPMQEEAIFDCHRAVMNCLDAGEPTTKSDFALHLAIAEATNNPRFPEFLTMLGAGIIPRAALQTNEGDTPRAYIGQLHEEHEAIIKAISNGDADAAKDAMRKHLKGSQARYRALLRR